LSSDHPVTIRVDGGPAHLLSATGRVTLAQNLIEGRHTIEITTGPATIDGFIIRNAPNRTPWLAAVMVVVLVAAWAVARRSPSPPTPSPGGRGASRP
ncbi:MAG: hypothetical protein ACT4QE_11960, partial [Anaerolineales bacterium]